MLVVGLGGTLRAGSSCEAALRIALDEAGRLGAATACFAGPHLVLPMYDPGATTRTPDAASLIAALRIADGVIIASPGYHGSISGLVKNALDYAEDMARDARVYLDGLPVGCIAVAYGPQAAAGTLSALRTVAHGLRGWPTGYGAAVTARTGLFTDGQCADEAITEQLRLVGRQVVEAAYRRAQAA